MQMDSLSMSKPIPLIPFFLSILGRSSFFPYEIHKFLVPDHPPLLQRHNLNIIL